MTLTTSSFAEHDLCPAFHTFSTRYQPLRVSMGSALAQSLHAAMENGNPASASQTLMGLATNPGIDTEAQGLYESVIHHSKLIELVSTYILAVGKVSTPSEISTPWGSFQPQSFLMGDGRLRRVILVDRWTADREKGERFSWRTAADTALSGRPMLITAIVIGGSRVGYRPSPWTQGFQHPQNGGFRVLKRDGESFGDSWRKVWREQTDVHPLEWLKIMQDDGAFEGRVFSFTEDVPRNLAEVIAHLGVMAGEIAAKSTRQTRASCNRFRPCPFLPACSSAQSPAQLGWVEKYSTGKLENATLSLTI